MRTRWIIGLDSGASGAGIDAVLLEVDGIGLDLRVRIVQSFQQPHGRELRELLARLAESETAELRQLGMLHRLLGEAFAAAARQVADRASFSLQNVFAVGMPGHVLWHDSENRLATALPLGMPGVVAERTGVTTIGDFRDRDLAAGGLGAPLTPIVDAILFRAPNEDRLLFHLGDTARLVYLPAGGHIDDVRGFEVGPCTRVLDALIRHVTGGRELFDAGGKHAVQGRCLDDLLRRWLLHPFLHRTPPRGLPRGEFGKQFAVQAVEQAREVHATPHDLLCTATHFVARTITQAARRYLPECRGADRVILSGGGVRNGFLWQLLQQLWPERSLERSDRSGVPAELLDAVSVGVLAALTIDGVPASLPAVTGAAGQRLLGSLTPGSSLNWARCLLWMAAQAAPLVTVEE